MSIDVRRLAIVVIMLAAVGAVVGGVLGGLLVSLLTLPHFFLDVEAIQVGASFGAAVGAVLAPIAAFSLMRRVPIWRAIAETAAGTVVGAGIGIVAQAALHIGVLNPILLGLIGFVAAAVRLRVTQGRKQLPSSIDA